MREHIGLKGLDEIDIGWSSRFVPASVESKVLEGLSCIELRVADLGDDRERIRDAMRNLDDLLWALIQDSGGAAYLLRISGDVSAKTRLKTYKGFSPKTAKESRDTVEQEISASGGSYFAGLLAITEENRLEYLSSAQDILRSCVLMSKDRRAGELWARLGATILDSLKINKDAVVIKYGALIPHIVSERETVVTFGIDTQGEFANTRLFLPDSFREDYLSRLRRLRVTFGES